VFAIFLHRQTAGIDGLHRAHRVALDAGDLHQAADRIAGHAEVMLHSNLGGVLHLLVRAFERSHQAAGRHRARDADVALTADLGSGDRGVFLVKHTDRAGRQEVPEYAFIGRAGDEAPVVVGHRGYESRGAVGGRCHHEPVNEQQRIAPAVPLQLRV
jgi:hypothetical protein